MEEWKNKEYINSLRLGLGDPKVLLLNGNPFSASMKARRAVGGPKVARSITARWYKLFF